MKKINLVILFLLSIFSVRIFFVSDQLFAQSSQRVLDIPEFRYNAYHLRNPFSDYFPIEMTREEAIEKGLIKDTEKKVVFVKPLPKFVVQGLIWGSDIPQAIVDGKVVKVGETIQEAKIIDISKEGIKVIFEGKRYTISPPAVSLKKKSLTSSTKSSLDSN